MRSFKFGETVQSLPIIAHEFGHTGPEVLILGGVHGDEWEGVVATMALQTHFLESFPFKLRLTLVPIFNLDGFIDKRRTNANKVDLNRNMSTNDWTSEVAKEKYYPGTAANSEPENQALTNWLSEHKPKLIISMHSWKPMININGNCKPEAEAISKMTDYIVTESIGYPTPGSLGTYAGIERDMPTITYEIERELEPKKIINNHIPAILEGLKVAEQRHR